MTRTHSVKYIKKEKSIELSIEPYAFKDIVSTYGKEQLMRIDQLFLFQNPEDKLSDYNYNEDFFSDFDVTLSTFSNFLHSIGEHKIYSLVFEIEDGTQFKIDDGLLTISAYPTKKEQLSKLLSLHTKGQDLNNYAKVVENQGRYVYFKKTSSLQIISNNELWNKFDTCSN